MMSSLFLLMTLSIGLIAAGKSRVVIGLLLITLWFCWVMLWYHATDILKINL